MLALLAYNGGQGRVRRWRGAEAVAGLPVDLFLETVEFAETRNYGRFVTGAAAVYRELSSR
jgi:soluble lytic murein transglycosylase